MTIKSVGVMVFGQLATVAHEVVALDGTVLAVFDNRSVAVEYMVSLEGVVK
jgi:hypothetical protein